MRILVAALLACAACGPRTDAADDTTRSMDTRTPDSRTPDSQATRAPAADPPSCGVGDRAVLTDGGIGALRVGATVADIRARCMVLSEDTAAPGPEGQTEHRIVVVTGAVNTTAAIVDGRVWRLYVASPIFRTPDSLGVGTRVARLRGPEARLARGEGTFVLRRDHCGLSFQLGRGVPPDAQTLDAVPDSVRVERVLVIACPGGGQR